MLIHVQLFFMLRLTSCCVIYLCLCALCVCVCEGGIYSASTSFEMTSSRVLQNEVTGGNCGGIAILRCESGTIRDSNISFNRALSGSSSKTIADGGGMCLELSSHVVIEGSTFESNIAAREGGGLVVWLAPNITVRRSNFFSNHATNGGAMSIQESLFVNISDVLLVGSSATNNGGGIAVQESPNLLIENSRFMSSQTSEGFGSSIW